VDEWSSYLLHTFQESQRSGLIGVLDSLFENSFHMSGALLIEAMENYSHTLGWRIAGINIYAFYAFLILMHHLLRLLHLFRLQPFHLRIGLCVLELPAWDFLGKQLVQLLVRSSRGLGLVNPQISTRDQRQAAEDEGNSCAQVALIWVEELRDHERPHGIDGVVNEDTDRDSLDAQAGVGCLAEERICYSSDADVVCPAVY